MEARRWIEDYAADVIRLTEQVQAIGANHGHGDYVPKCTKRAALMCLSHPLPEMPATGIRVH